MSLEESGSDVTEGPAGPVLVTLFQERRDAFLDSLERVVESVGGDRFIAQMFQDEDSAIYVSNRICEIVYHVLADEREKFVNSLMERVRAVEAFFGESKAHEIIAIGNRLIEMTSQQTEKEAEQRERIKILNEQLHAVQCELSSLNAAETAVALKESGALKEMLANLKEECMDVKQAVTEITGAVSASLSESIAHVRSTKEQSEGVIMKFVEQARNVDGESEKLDTEDGPENMMRRLERAAKLAREKDAKIVKLKAKLDAVKQHGASSEVQAVKQKLEKAIGIIKEKDGEISRLQDEIGGLDQTGWTKKLQKAKALLHAKDEAIKQLQTEIEDLRQANIKSSDEKVQKKLRRAVEMIQTRDSEIEQLKDTLSQQQDLTQKLKTKVEAAKSVILQKNERIESLENVSRSGEKFQKRSAKLERALARATQAMVEKDETIKGLNQQVQEMEKLKASLRKQSDQYQKSMEIDKSPNHMRLSELDDSDDAMYVDKSSSLNRTCAQESDLSRSTQWKYQEDGQLNMRAICQVLDAANLTGDARDIVKRALMDAQRQVNRSRRALDNLETQNNLLRKQRSKQEEHLVQLEDQITQDDELLASSRQADTTIQEQQATISRLKLALQQQQKYAQSEQECERIKEQMYELEEAFSKIASDNRELSGEVTCLQQELSDYKAQSEKDFTLISQLKSENQDLRSNEQQLSKFVSQISACVGGSTLQDILHNVSEMKKATEQSERDLRSVSGFDNIGSLVSAYRLMQQNEKKLVDMFSDTDPRSVYESILELKTELESQSDTIRAISDSLDVDSSDVLAKVRETIDTLAKFTDRERKIEKLCGEDYSFAKVVPLLEQQKRDGNDQKRSVGSRQSTLVSTFDKLKQITQTTTEDQLLRATQMMNDFKEAVSRNYPGKQNTLIIDTIDKEHKLIGKLGSLFGVADLCGELRTISQKYESNKRLAKFETFHQQQEVFRRLWDQEQSIKKLLHCDGPIIDEIKKIQENTTVKDEKKRMKVESVDETSAKVLNEMKNILKVEQMNDLQDKVHELLDIAAIVTRAFGTENNFEIERQLGELKEVTEQNHEMKDELGLDENEDPVSHIVALKKGNESLDKIIQELSRNRHVEDASDIVDVIEELSSNEKKIMDVLGVEFPEDLLEKLKDVQEERDRFDQLVKNIEETIGASDETDLVDKVNDLVRISEDRSILVRECCELLDVTEESCVVTRLKEFVETDSEIKQTLNVSSSAAIIDELTSLKSSLTNISQQVASVRLFGTSQKDDDSSLMAVTHVCEEFNGMRHFIDVIAEELALDPNRGSMESLFEEIQDKIKKSNATEQEVSELIKRHESTFTMEGFCDKVDALAETVQELCLCLKCDDSGLVRVVKELGEHHSEVTSIVSKCHDLAKTKEAEDLYSAIERNGDIVKCLCSLFSVTDPSIITEKVQMLIQDKKACCDCVHKFLSSMAETDEEMALERVKEMRKMDGDLMKLTKTTTLEDMMESVGEAVRAVDRLKKELGLDATLDAQSMVNAVVDQTNGQKKFIESMEKLMTVGGESEMIGKMKELNEIIAGIQAMLSLKDQGQILARIGAMSKTLRSLLSLLGVNESGVIEAVSSLKSEHAKLEGVLQKAERVTDAHTSEEMLTAIQQLKLSDHKIRELVGGDPIEQVKQLANERKKLERILGSGHEDDMSQAVADLRKQVSDSEKLSKKLQSLTKTDSESTMLSKLQQLVTDDGRIGSLLDKKNGESNVDGVRSMVQTMKKLAALVPNEEEPNMVNRVMAMRKSLGDAEKCLDQLRKVANVNTNGELTKAVVQMSSEMKKVEGHLEKEPGATLQEKTKQAAATLQRLNSVVKVENSTELPKAVAEIQKQLESLKASVKRLAETSEGEDPCDKLKDIVAERKRLRAILKIDDTDSIPDTVKSIAEKLDKIISKLPDCEEDIAEYVGKLVKIADEHKAMTDELAGSLSVTKGEICRAVADMAKEKSSLIDILKDTSGNTLMEKASAIKNVLVSAASTLECDDDNIAPTLLSMKKELESMRQVMDHLRGITETKDDSDIEKVIQEWSELFDNICSIFDVKLPSDAVTQAKSSQELIQQVSDLFELKKQDDLVTHVSKALEELNDMRAIVNDCMTTTDQHEPAAMVERVKEMVKTEQQLRALLGGSDEESLIGPVETLKSCVDEITAHVNELVNSDGDLITSFESVCGELASARNLIDAIAKRLGVSSECPLKEKSEEILKKLEELDEQGANIRQLLGDGDRDVSELVAELVETLKEVESYIPSAWKGDCREKVKALTDEFDQIREAVQGSEQPLSTLEKVKAVLTQYEDLKEAAEKAKEIFKSDDMVSAAEELSSTMDGIKEKLEVKTNDQVQHKLENLLEFEKRVCDALPGTKKNQIPEAIENLTDKCQNYEQQLQDIAKALTVKRFDDISDRLDKALESEKAIDQIGKMLRVSIPEEIVDRVKLLNNQNNALAKMLKSADVPDAVQALLDDAGQLKASISKAMSLMKPHGGEADNIVEAVTEICTQLKDLKDRTKSLKSVLKDDDVITKAKEFSDCVSKARDVLGTDDVVDALKKLVAREKEINRIWNSKTSEDSLAKLKEVHTALSKPENIPMTVKKLLDDISKYKANEAKILDLLPSMLSEDAAAEVTLLVNQFNDLQKHMDAILELTSTTTSDDAVDAVEYLSRTLGFIKQALGNTEDPVSSLRELLNEKKKIAELVELENGPNGDVATLVKCYASSSSFLCHLLSIITRTNVKLTFPMTESIKTQYTEYATNLVEEHENIANEKREVIKRARAQGYLERGSLGEAVDFIVNTEVGNEKQKILEEMHSHAQNVRLIQEKERQGFEKSKKAYKQTIEDLRAQINEMQELNLARDEQRHDEIAEHKNSSVEMERKYEREKRIHEELIRLLKHNIVDFEFLNSNLSRDEMRAIEKYKQK